MKAALYYCNDDVRVVDVSVPEIGPGEVLVEMKACGICGSDVLEWYRKPRAPMHFGHELTGVIKQVGKGVNNFQVGDRVFVHHHVPCFVCHYCQRGSYTMCPTYHGTHLDPGGFAEFVRVPAINVERGMLKLPPEISFEEGTLIEPVSCCLRGLKKSEMREGDTVLVIGAGASGLIHVQLAKLLGAGMVIVSDLIDNKLTIAREFGADYTVNPQKEDIEKKLRQINEGRLADLVVVTPASTAAIKQGIYLADKGATVYIFGPTSPEEAFSLVPHHLFFSEIKLMASYSSYIAETKVALDYIKRKKINSAKLITHRFSLDEIGKAMKLVAKAQESLKVVIVRD